MNPILIKNVFLVDPATQTGKDFPVTDIVIEKGKIAQLGKSLEAVQPEVIEGKGLYVFPGFVDLHTHFREPGFEAKETVHTGARAGIRGGYVASVSMPNTQPPCDQHSIIDNIIRKAKEVPYHIFPAGTISKGRAGKELSEMADMKKAGIVAVTDDGSWVHDTILMRRAMEYASMLELIVMSHCQDCSLSAEGVMNEGFVSTKLGLRGIPSASEDVAVARDIELARLTKARLHICHISSSRAVELVRRAKEEGISVTAEVTPHNLTLTDDAVEGYNPNMKMYPPLRTREDTEALKKGLKEGVIDCIATDHAPHTDEDKMAEFDKAPFGTLGLETALSVVLTHLYHGGGWNLLEIAKIMSQTPAKILNLGPQFGTIRKGSEANLALVDINKTWKVGAGDFVSKSRNSCFIGASLKGRVTATVCAGKLWKFENQESK